MSSGNHQERRTIVSRIVFARGKAFAFHLSFAQGFTRLVAAALLAVLAGLVMIEGVAAKDYPPVGASGNDSKRDKCKPGQYLVGVKVKSGAWVDQMYIICSTVRDGATFGTDYGTPRGGTGGGPPIETYCAPDEIIRGMGLIMTAGNRQVQMFQFNCVNMKTSQRHNLDAGAKSTVFPSINQPCPAGEAAVGIEVRFGQHVNAAGLLCDKEPAVNVAGGPAGGSSGGNSCPTVPAGQSPGHLMGMVKCIYELAGRAPSSFATADQDAGVSEARVLCLINAERTCRGLPALKLNARLSEAAKWHAVAAKDQKWWVKGADSHTNPKTGATVETRIKSARYCWDREGPVREVGYKENTYHGAGTGGNHSNDAGETNFKCPGVGCGSPLAAVDWWINISTHGHRETILDPKLEDIGIAALGEVASPNFASAPNRGLYVVDFGFCHR